MATTRAFTREEIRAILKDSEVSLRDRCYISLSANTGFRVSEILSLRIGDVVNIVGKGEPPIIKSLREVTVVKDAMKGKQRARTMALNRDVQKAIHDYVKVCMTHEGATPDTMLFLTPVAHGRQKNKPLTRQYMLKITKAIADRVLGYNNRIGTHSFRKAFATECYRKCRDVVKVSMMMGHRQIQTTMNYIQSLGGDHELVNGLF